MVWLKDNPRCQRFAQGKLKPDDGALEAISAFDVKCSFFDLASHWSREYCFHMKSSHDDRIVPRLLRWGAVASVGYLLSSAPMLKPITLACSYAGADLAALTAGRRSP